MAQAGAVGDVVIVDTASLPTMPVFPKRPLIMGLALALGLILGVGTAIGRRVLFEGIEDPEVLDRILDLPVNAVVPHSERQDRLERKRLALVPGEPPLLAAQGFSDDATSESLRGLRTALQLILPKSGPNILCLTSLGPSEGKSFVASNLSYLFGQAGSRVLLVDADLRRGHLHRTFGLAREPGLAEALAGKVSVEKLVHQIGDLRLDVLTTGTLPDDAANLLLASDLAPIMEKLSALYDLVIVEVPPILTVSDAFVLARHATLCLLVLKYGLHSERRVELAQKRFKRHNIVLAGSVLNDVSVAAQRYAYSHYGYHYHYRSEGEEPTKGAGARKPFWERRRSALRQWWKTRTKVWGSWRDRR